MVGSYNWILKCETPDARTFHSDHGLGNWKAFSVSPTPQCWMQSDLGFRDSWNKCDMILNVGYSSWASVALRFSGLCNSSSERKQYILKSCTGSPFLTLEVPASLTFKPPAQTSWIRGRSAGWGPDTVPSILFLSHWIFPAVMLFPFYRDEAGTQRLELVSDGARMPTLTTICCPSQVAHFSLTPDVSHAEWEPQMSKFECPWHRGPKHSCCHSEPGNKCRFANEKAHPPAGSDRVPPLARNSHQEWWTGRSPVEQDLQTCGLLGLCRQPPSLFSVRATPWRLPKQTCSPSTREPSPLGDLDLNSIGLSCLNDFFFKHQFGFIFSGPWLPRIAVS